jgi:ACS family glucarate transporter-like MFS transporter
MTASPAAVHEKDAPTAVRWRIVALLMGGSFLSWFNRVSMSVAGSEQFIPRYGIDPTDMGLVYSALLLAYAVCMTPGGFLIDAKGARAALVLMGIGSGLFVIATGAIGWLLVPASFWLALVIVRACVGVCMAPIYPASGRIIAHWLPLPQRSWANGLVNGAAPVGTACTFFGFGILIDRFDWPTAFVLTGILTVFMGVVWMLYARDYPQQHPGVNPAELRTIAGDEEARKNASLVLRSGDIARSPGWLAWLSLLRNRSLVLLTVSYAAVGYAEYLFNFWTEYYFESVLDLGKDRSRLYSTILYLAMAAGMGLGGLLSDRLLRAWGYRWGRAAVPIGGMLMSAILVLVGLGVHSASVTVFCFALSLAALGACEGPCWATAIELGGRRGGTAAGIFNTGGNLGGLIAPTLTPWVSSRFGWGWGIALGGIACLLGVGLWLGVDPGERLPESADPLTPGRE